jgi:hypothetical protein
MRFAPNGEQRQTIRVVKYMTLQNLLFIIYYI